MKILSRLSAALLLGALAALLLACPERTTEQAGPDPRLEAEVERLRLALGDRQLGTPGGPAVTIALVDGGELRWARAFGAAQDGSLIDPALPEITTASPLLHHSLGHDRAFAS